MHRAQYFIVTPNVIRVDVEETVLVNVLDAPDGVKVPVTLYFQLSGSNQRISETTVTVGKGMYKVHAKTWYTYYVVRAMLH